MIASYNTPHILEEYLFARIGITQAEADFDNTVDAVREAEVALQAAIVSAFSTEKIIRNEHDRHEMIHAHGLEALAFKRAEAGAKWRKASSARDAANQRLNQADRDVTS